MSKLSSDNPFNPGGGVIPPYFAGRKEEEIIIEKILHRATGQINKYNDLPFNYRLPHALIGPKGVGKTLILSRTLKNADELGITTLYINDLDLENNFIGLKDRLFIKTKRKLCDSAKNNDVSKFRKYLEKSIKKPLLIACDNADAINIDDFNRFYNLILDCICNFIPINVIFAGTPKIIRMINNLENIKSIKFNSLSDKEITKAIKFPFNKNKVKFRKDSIDNLIKQSDNYPYFTQIIGYELWEIVHKNNLKIIDKDTVKLAFNRSQKKINEFNYHRVSRYLNKSNFRNEIYKTLIFIRDQETGIHIDKFNEYINKTFKKEITAKLINELFDLDYLWNYYDFILPSQPSFMNYVINNFENY